MRGPVSPDGVLAAHPAGDGRAAIFFEEDVFSPEFSERLAASDKAIKLLGRSLLGQVGIDVVIDGDPLSNVEKRGTIVPVRFDTYTPLAGALTDDFYELIDKTTPGYPVEWRKTLGIGRFVDLSQLVRFEDAEEVQRDLDEGMIYFGGPDADRDSSRVNSDGSISAKLVPTEFRFNEKYLVREASDQPLAPSSRRLDLVPRGRGAAARHTDEFRRDPSSELPDFTLGGLPFSPGNRYWRVRPEVSSHVFQLESAALFDGNRLAGLGGHLDAYDRLRQVELVRRPLPLGAEAPTFDNTWVTIDVYKSKSVEEAFHSATNWSHMDRAARIRRHIRGITALEALETADEVSREALLQEVRKPDVAALIVTRRGVEVVPESGSDKHNARNIQDRLRDNPDGIPDNLQHLEPQVRALQVSGDRTATVAAQNLRIGDLALHVESGASALLTENFMPENGSVSPTDLSTLMKLSRKVVGLAQSNGDYREFHPMGVWLKHGMAEALEGREFYTLFGARRDKIGDRFHKMLGALMDELIAVRGADSMAFVHGNGDGMMNSTCENARERGIPSIATGITAQEMKNNADGYFNLGVLYYIFRQHQLDSHTTYPIVTMPSGFGSEEELYNVLTSRKLLIRVPAPVFISALDGHRRPMSEGRRQMRATRKTIEYISNQEGDPDSPRKYVKNLIHYGNRFEGISDEVQRFNKSRPAWWEEAGVPPRHVAKCHVSRLRLVEELCMVMPQEERKAAEEYAGDFIDQENELAQAA